MEVDLIGRLAKKKWISYESTDKLSSPPAH